MSIKEIVESRKITEVLHFTTNKGLLGILDSESLCSRKRLEPNQRLKYILKCNSKFRKDLPWLDYVNLSISDINKSFFNHSKGWHEDIWWCILSFDPLILEHDGVHFATTNNIYTNAIRGKGCNGLESLFVETVHQYQALYAHRGAIKQAMQTTCNQAEVLYPGEISTDFLKAIYVYNEDEIDQVRAQIAAVGHRDVAVICDKSKF